MIRRLRFAIDIVKGAYRVGRNESQRGQGSPRPPPKLEEVQSLRYFKPPVGGVFLPCWLGRSVFAASRIAQADKSKGSAWCKFAEHHPITTPATLSFSDTPPLTNETDTSNINFENRRASVNVKLNASISYLEAVIFNRRCMRVYHNRQGFLSSQNGLQSQSIWVP
ncbi:hypothetical protein BDZ94DRAFT_736875 [Collybia nuda]|uniref:Uncharacterized protein n=1 Tax=Collybia nuda TaxID=64659 RepID=A0A9P5Y2Y7_9AGAR|nr:hypothetical protein BDZ94DRAFT_736875 [Collybia nuda]